LMRQHGAPISGTGLDILISGWAVCGALAKSALVLGTSSLHGSIGNAGHVRKHNALAKSVIALGTLASSGIRLGRLRNKANAAHHEDDANDDDDEGEYAAPRKLGVASKIVQFGTRLIRRIPGSRRKQYHRKVGDVASCEFGQEDHSHLWQMLPPGEVLHCLRGGAKTLDGEDFKQLLQAAWVLFDECDAVSWMIEPKEGSDSRAVQLLAVQKALAEVVTVDSQPGQLAVDAEPMHQQLCRSHAIIHQLKEICDGADDGLLRRAALYGLPILLERASVWLHASVGQITNQIISKPSRVAAHDMDCMVAKILESFTPYEIAVEDGLGYQMPHHSLTTYCRTSRDSPTGGAAVVCEEAWRRFLRSKENGQQSKLDDRNEEPKEHTLASPGRFCTHKLLTPGFGLRHA